jgi:hypothetical protein
VQPPAASRRPIRFTVVYETIPPTSPPPQPIVPLAPQDGAAGSYVCARSQWPVSGQSGQMRRMASVGTRCPERCPVRVGTLRACRRGLSCEVKSRCVGQAQDDDSSMFIRGPFTVYGAERSHEADLKQIMQVDICSSSTHHMETNTPSHVFSPSTMLQLRLGLSSVYR